MPRPSVPQPMTTSDFIASLEQQESAQCTRDIDEGLLLPGATLAALLKMTPRSLNQARKAGRLFALHAPAGALVYPAFLQTRVEITRRSRPCPRHSETCRPPLNGTSS
jgi:hypothetical protein